MITENQYEEAVKVIVAYRKQIEDRLKTIKIIGVIRKDELIIQHLSIRVMNCLHVYFKNENRAFQYESLEKAKVSDLEFINISKLKKTRNFGKHCLYEITELAQKANVTLNY